MVFLFQVPRQSYFGTEWLSFLEDSVDTGVKKIRGALCSACSSAVALPMSRVVDLNQSLVSPIALLNCVAWVPFLKRGGPWFSSMCDHWWGVLGFRKEPKKNTFFSPGLSSERGT